MSSTFSETVLGGEEGHDTSQFFRQDTSLIRDVRDGQALGMSSQNTGNVRFDDDVHACGLVMEE